MMNALIRIGSAHENTNLFICEFKKMNKTQAKIGHYFGRTMALSPGLSLGEEITLCFCRPKLKEITEKKGFSGRNWRHIDIKSSSKNVRTLLFGTCQKKKSPRS